VWAASQTSERRNARVDVAAAGGYKEPFEGGVSVQSLRQHAKTFGRPAWALAAALAALLALRAFAAQESQKPLSEEEVIELLTNDVAPPRVAQLARQFGISFQMTTSAEQDLREAGADESLIDTLRKLAPKPSAPPASQPATPAALAPSPPVLLILSSPGGAEVYIDDEPIGTTSSEGRLRMSKLGAGNHRIRLSHDGYKDFEQTVDLVSGLLTVTAQLQPAAISSASSAASHPGEASSGSTSSGGPAGVMGMFMRTAAAGGKTGEVLGLVPGGPAERAGIRPGYVVHSIAGRNVATQDDIKQAIAGRLPGSVVPVTYTNGSTRNTVHVTLDNPSILQTVPHFLVRHDHGPPAPNYCQGWMWIFDGMISYVGQQGVNPSGTNGIKHNFELPMSEIREVSRNGFYLAAIGAFHIRPKRGRVANFVVVNPQGQFQRPDQILAVIERARR
jgi:hypothetical protein